MSSILADIQSLSPGGIVELFELDTTNLPDGTKSYFHAGANAMNGPVIWQGISYASLPIEASGFDVTTSGTLPRPRIRAANIGGLFSAVNMETDDLVGCKIIRRRTLVKYLDVENWVFRNNTAQGATTSTITLDLNASDVDDYYNRATIHLLSGAGAGQQGVIADYDGAEKKVTIDGTWSTLPNSTTVFEIRHPDYGKNMADPNQHFPDDLWYVEQKINENKYIVEWELASAFDLQGVMLPYRQIIQDSCPWKYRGSECGYTGTAYFDLHDDPTTQANDFCAKHLSSCKARFPNQTLPFGGFPGAVRFEV